MNVLAFFAHPDDETMLAGGTLALLAQHGAQVHYLCATRGEGGEVGNPPLCTQDELGCSARAGVGVRRASPRRPQPDLFGLRRSTRGPRGSIVRLTSDLTLLAGQVAASMRQFGIQAVITHGSNGEYGHPRTCSPTRRRASRSSRWAIKAPLLYTVSAAFPEHPRPRLANRDDPADLVLDVTSALELKTPGALCHRTQHALFVRRSSQEAGRPLSVPEVVIAVESLHRAIPSRKRSAGRPAGPVIGALAGAPGGWAILGSS